MSRWFPFRRFPFRGIVLYQMYARDSGSISEYQLTGLQSLEASDDTYQAVHSMWDDAVDFSEPDSEEEEEDEE